MSTTNRAATRSMRVLYMESDVGSAQRVRRGLTQAGYTVDLAHDGSEGLVKWRSNSYDAVVVNQEMTALTGMEVIRRLASLGPLPPVVIVVEPGDEQVAVQAMSLGASDYVVKDEAECYVDLFPFVIDQTLRYRDSARVQATDLSETGLGLRAISAVSRAISSSMEMEDMLHQTIACIVRVVGFSGGLIALTDDSLDEVIHFSHVGVPPSLLERLRTSDLKDVTRDLVYREEIPFEVEEQRGDAPIEERDLLVAGFLAYVGMRIVHKGRALGALWLFDGGAHPLTEYDRQLLMVIGRQVGMAVENLRLFEDVVHEREVAQTLLGAAKTLSAVLQTDQLLECVLDELQHVVSYDAASISLLPDESRLHDPGRVDGDVPAVWTVAARGVAPGSIIERGRAFDLKAFPLFCRVVDERKPIVVPDAQCKPELFSKQEADRARSWLSVPLIFRDRVIGVMMVNSQCPDAYNEEMVRLMFAFAHQVALAIENSRLHGQTQAQLREAILLHSVTAALSSTLDIDQMLPYVARSLCEILNGTRAKIYNLDEETDSMVVAADYIVSGASDKERQSDLGRTYGLDDVSIMWEVLSRNRPQQLCVSDSDLDATSRDLLEDWEAKAALLLPMMAHSRTVGLAVVQESQGSRRFTQGEIATGQTLTHQAAIAIDHARLFEEMQKATKQMSALYKTSRALSSSLDKEQLVRTILEAVYHSLECEHVLISIVDEAARTIGVQHGIWRGEFDAFPEWIQGAQYSLDQSGILSDVCRTGRIEIVEEGDDRFDGEIWDEFGYERSLSIFMPIKMRQRVIGVVEVGYDRDNKDEISDDEVQLLTMFMDQAAVALENARLFEAASRRAHEMQFLHDVSLAAATKMGLQETLQGAADALAAELEGTRVALWLLSSESDLLCLEAGVGYPSNLIGNLRLKLGEGISGWVTQHGEPVIVPDVRSDRRYYQVIPGARSELCVPLTAGPFIIGALSVESPRFNAFTGNDLRLLSTLASNLALLVERVRLFSEVEAARVELQQRAEALEEANARLQELDRLKDQFFASVSHEFRTPLNSIIGFSEVLLKGMMGELTPKQQESIQHVLSSGEDLLSMINDILDFSKIQAGRMTLEPTTFDMVELLREVQATLAPLVEKKSQTLVLSVKDDLPLLTADRFRIKQVLLNLLSNANKFASVGGRIEITCQVRDSSSMLCSVADDGMGIKQEEQDIIFDDFRQAGGSPRLKVRGTGLGLAISKRLIEMHRGYIWVESEYGHGATFFFVLPLEGPSG